MLQVTKTLLAGWLLPMLFYDMFALGRLGGLRLTVILWSLIV